MTPDLIKNYTAGGTIPAYTIVKWDSSDGSVVAASAAADYLMGVTMGMATVSTDRVDVIKSGIADVLYGGTITRGAPVTADSNGKAVVAAPSAGSNVRIIGFAEVSAASGDIAPININPGIMQG
jgi:hypothetical protein